LGNLCTGIRREINVGSHKGSKHLEYTARSQPNPIPSPFQGPWGLAHKAQFSAMICASRCRKELFWLRSTALLVWQEHKPLAQSQLTLATLSTLRAHRRSAWDYHGWPPVHLGCRAQHVAHGSADLPLDKGNIARSRHLQRDCSNTAHDLHTDQWKRNLVSHERLIDVCLTLIVYTSILDGCVQLSCMQKKHGNA
jgi:hypothetical protein